MDSQHKHELQENDLASLLTGAKSVWNDKDWWTRYGNKILLVLLLVSAAFLAKTWADNRTAAVHEQKWADLGMANSPDSYDAIAKSYSDPAVKSLALLREGDLYAQRAASGETIISTMSDPSATQPSKVTTDPKQDAANAVACYQQVIAIPNVKPLIRLNAILGLASAYETQGDWAKASTTYEQLQTEAKDVSPILEVRAKNHLEMLPRLNQPVVFAPEPAPSNAAGTSSSNAPSPLPGLGTIPLTTVSPAAASPAPVENAEKETPATPAAE